MYCEHNGSHRNKLIFCTHSFIYCATFIIHQTSPHAFSYPSTMVIYSYMRGFAVTLGKICKSCFQIGAIPILEVASWSVGVVSPTQSSPLQQFSVNKSHLGLVKMHTSRPHFQRMIPGSW